MRKVPLKPFKTYQENLLHWVKAYLAHKVLELFKNSKENTIDDIIVYRDLLLNANDFAKVQSICKELRQHGLQSISMLLNSVSKFYPFALKNASDLTEFDDDLIYNFADSLKLADSSKKGYVDCALQVLAFIENTNTDGFKFNIEYEGARLKKSKPKVYDAMDDEEFARFSKMLPQYDKYKNEFEKCRTVLICRIMLYSGITPKELVSLKLGKSLIKDKKSIYISKSIGRTIDIELPRNKLIKYLNRYLELKEENEKGYLFYAPTNKDEMLSTTQVNELVKTMLKYAKIERKEMNATLLRVSLAVYLYNHRKDGKHFHLSAIQAIMGHKNRADTEKMIGFHAKKYAVISDVFLDDDFD